MKGLVKLGLFALLVYAYVGKSAQQVLYNLSISLKNISIAVGATVFDVLQGIKPIVLTVDAVNNTNVGSYIDRFTGTATMNGMVVANLDIPLDIDINPGATVTVDVPIYLDFESVVSVIGDSINKKEIPPIVLVGDLVASNLVYAVNETFYLQ